MLLRLAFQFLRCIKKCSGKFAQTAARNRISSRSKNIFALALKTFGKNPSGGGVGNEGERLRVWDYPNEQNAGAFYGKGTPFLCLLRKKQAANGYTFAVLAHYSKSRKGMKNKLKTEHDDLLPKKGNTLHETVCYKIGGTIYEVETFCGGSELLYDKMTRLIKAETVKTPADKEMKERYNSDSNLFVGRS